MVKRNTVILHWFVIAPLNELTLIAARLMYCLAFIYLNIKQQWNGSVGGNSGLGDPLGDILNDY